MEQMFYITYYADKHKSIITRRGKHGEKSRYGTSKKKNNPYYIYYDLDSHNYRCSNAPYKVRY